MIELERGDVDFKRFENRAEYVSVVITYVKGVKPESKRYKLLENCIDSIHRHADYPFEIIVVDDSGIELSSLHVKDKISTLVLNMGKPFRQNVQQNRGIACASSKYVIRVEDDTEITRPCFQDLVNVLDKPYVGFLNPEGIHPNEYLTHRGTKFIIGGGLGGAWCNCFRKNVWKEVGGLPEWSHSSNPPFCQRILKHGYWRAYLVGDRFCKNTGKERSTFMSTGRTNYPKLFKISENEQDKMSRQRHVLSRRNYDECSKAPGSVSNHWYWRDYHDAVTPDRRRHSISSIDWGAAERHGQAKWKEQILAETVHYMNIKKEVPLKKGDIYVGIGTQRVWSGGKTVLVHPDPKIIEGLRPSSDDNLILIQKAPWVEEGTVKLYQPKSGASSRLLPKLSPERTKELETRGDIIDVEADTLDNIFDDLSLNRVDWLVIDTEETEMGTPVLMKILKGAAQSLGGKRIRNVAITTHHRRAAQDEVKDILKGHSYIIKQVKGRIYGHV